MSELKSIIELDKVLKNISKHCFSDYGKEALINLEPFKEDYRLRLKRSSELYRLILRYGEPPLYGVLNLKSEMQQARSGAILSGEQLSRIAKTLNAICRLKQFFEQYSEDIPELWSLLSSLNCEKTLINAINHAINEEGEVVDKASPLLKEIRNELKQLNRTLRSKLELIVSNYRTELTDSIALTREGRYVLPLIASRKALYDGIIHGSSGSGATVYFEPKELIPLNNRLRVLKSSEEEEVRRILRELTTKFLRITDRLEEDLHIISELDINNASATYAKKHQGSFVFPHDGKSMVLLKARHPLIDDDKVVPIDFTLPEETGAVVITGPNTGGKTVALKTIGLCVLMTMCGLPVLASESSKIPEFKNVFVDIGDEQSIEQSLSTFSSHISRIIEVLNNCDKDSLVLLDELGAGTDPVEGAALSMAIIDTLLGKRAKSVISTHLSPLKIYALNRPDVMNASVEFDVDTLKPTYHLIMGIPGSSNALEISNRLGLPKDVLNKAREYMSNESANFETLISELHKERSKMEIIKRELIEEKKRLEELKEKYDERFEKLKEKRLGELDDELKELEEKLNETIKKLEKSISLGRSEKEEDKVKAVKELYEAKKMLNNIPLQSVSGNAQIEAGDNVKILDTGVIAEVISVKDGKAFLKAGIMTLEVPLAKLEKTKSHQNGEKEESYSVISGIDSSSDELDIRGMTTDDVPFVLDDFLDSLIRAKRSKGYIIHGKGTGKLAEAVWKYLRRSKLVKHFRIGTPKEGGHGVTVIEV
ncbi:DNA mismatch repair protein MutS [Kosmotoga arenicorallina S304]|uniref:Endonuclease MutS2 n=1 Tax=Kosmotoga arenicorallina S304 TaxID=1453497 RepID=A0A176JWF7_9BACT|nr:endonuclease MutS2 [Kosmotoga arenicorallina]OAA28021.1 DNA mismatch repair protein MutS [Kosmotoga arenicorallina S304]